MPEWYAIADAEQRRASSRKTVATVEEKLERVAAQQGFAILPRSTTEFYRRPDVWVMPIEDVRPSRVTLIWDADVADPVRDDFVSRGAGMPRPDDLSAEPSEHEKMVRHAQLVPARHGRRRPSDVGRNPRSPSAASRC